MPSTFSKLKVLPKLQHIMQEQQKQQQGDPVVMATLSVLVPVTVAVFVSQQQSVWSLIFQSPSNDMSGDVIGGAGGGGTAGGDGVAHSGPDD
mmetsp:Transcript_10959/g.19825  ORF Transcript_10959/g.19825 Transcript_10959/m.19825 type:complete len:92 (-) Transcript_10959:16-291(-)